MTQYAFDGRYFGEQTPSLPADCALVLRGEGWFETLRVAEGQLMFWPKHRARLLGAAAGPVTDPAAGFASILLDDTLGALAPAIGNCARGRLRVLLTPDAVYGRWHCLASIDPIAAATLDESAAQYVRGVSAAIVPLAHPGLGALGKSASYHWSWVAREQARLAGADEALLARDGRLVEAATASVLLHERGEWCCLGGDEVLRSVTVDRLRATGLHIAAGELSLSRLQTQDARAGDIGLVLASAVRLVVPIRSVDGCELADMREPAARLRAALWSLHADADASPSS